ncbi:L,D-transpeptidase [Uliginosibacterium flavum]|uniref:L,D-transpeptidase n=1 Tax=Uliginosibacterium flavum TaxID=1396831 RepID=A0ABV2TL78_9RHOO
MEIRVSIGSQRMLLVDTDGACIRRYAISTAALGAGEQIGSFQTPRGRHLIRARIGAGLPLCAVFKARRPTGEVWTPDLQTAQPERDWILSRILWLSGTEVGCNRLGCVDSMRRYIYIHGTPDTEPMGVAASHGCIRMRNRDVVELFELVQAGTPVLIEA